ncbi:hypothetical protein CsatA_008031 [Cannabis sativa]
MTSRPSKNIWIQRQQCPCGDWKCYVTYEGDAEETSIASQLVKNDTSPSEAMISPYVGMVFKSDDDAFEYYGNFARKNGFSIRKERSRLSPQLGIYKRDFVCYRSGFAPVKKKPTGEHHRDRKSMRCGCDAKMYLSKEIVDGDSQWFVVQFSNVHNHELLEDDQVLELQKGIQGGQLPFLERDVRNFVQNRKKVVQENDALLTEKRESDTMELLEACKVAKYADENFVYDFTVDENDKVYSWFFQPLGSRFAEFKSEFDTLCRLETTEEFELQWNQMISVFRFNADKHIALLYSFRSSWAPSYTRGYLLARMATTVYSKSVDGFLKGIFNAQTCLRTFFEQVSISANFQNQARPEMQYMYTKTCIPIEERARSILMPFVFNEFQHELALSMQYATSEMANGSYIVRHFKKMDGERLVIWVPEDEQIHCSCKEFESSGLLCRHALRVFIVKNYFQLPEKYYLNRWRRESSLVFYEENGTQHSNDDWIPEFQCLMENLFAESSITRERSDYARSELIKQVARILNEVGNMTEAEGVAMDVTLSPNG